MATTFTRTTPGTYNETTGQWTTPITSTISGNAIQVKGDPMRYAALSLNLSSDPTLFFSPTSYNLKSYTGEFVEPGDTVVWNDTTYSVRDVQTIAPDGVVIAARIVVSA